MEAEEIRFGGANLTECEAVKLGAHHTLTVDMLKTLGIHKV